MPSLRTHLSFAAIALLFLAACDRGVDRVVGPTTTVVSPVHRTSSLSPDEIRTILGPKLFVRSTGAPVTDTISIAGYASDATLRIVNGDALGNYRATSGTVLVDGQEVVHPSAFGKQVGSISVPITLRNTSVIGVRLAGSPGDQVTMSIEGHLATTATVTGAGGTIHLLGTQVTLTFPVGAVSGSVVVTSVPAPAPSPEAAPGTTVDQGPSGTVFSSPVTLSIAFDPTTLPRGARPASLRMHWWNTDHWEKLPGNSVDLQRGVVSAQVTHFTTFALLPNEVEFCTSDPTAESDLQTAITHVPAGGTVYVCDGRHVANDVTIDRPLMLAAEHAGMATLVQPDTATALTPVLRINGVADGTVSIVNMNVEFRRIGLLAMALYDQIVVTGTAFSGTGVSAGTGVQLIETSVPTAKVTFDHDTFTNSYVGLNQFQPVDIDVFHSDFHDLRNYALIIFTANGSQNPSPTGTPIMRTARVQWNTFRNCGNAGCIALQQAGRDTVRFNQISMPSGNVSNGIFLYRDGQPADLIAPNVITDNTITGHGPTGDSTVSSNWGVTRALSSRQGPAPTLAPGVADIFERNTINGAFVGLSVLGPIMMVATDNRVANTYAAINYGGTDPVKAHRNDFVGYHYPIAQSMASIPLNAQPANAVPGSLTCNYWGSPSGPIGVFPGVPLASYTRYSAVPIAGNPSVTCDPTTIPPTVRACATPSSDGMLTKPTVLEAYNAVPSGGTVLVCDGTFVVSNLTISKPVTITAEGPGMPTLDAGGGTKVFGIQNVMSGAVTISKLQFTGGVKGQVTVNWNVATANITDNEFHPPQTQPYPVQPLGYVFGVQVNGSGIGTVNIDQNAFIGGDLGVAINTDTAFRIVPIAQVNVTRNTFSSQVTSSISISGASTTVYDYNIDRNSFEDCLLKCIFTWVPVRVVNNTFTAHIEHPAAENMIQLHIQGVNANLGTVTDNTIVGIGSNGTDRSLATTYPVRAFAILISAGVADVSRNHITNAYNGIGLWNKATVTASDNVIQTSFAPLAGNGRTVGNLLTANWNDLSDYVTAVGNPGALNLGALNIRCNWWGQATGPTSNYPAVPLAAYTPFAVAPVAGQAHAGCTGQPAFTLTLNKAGTGNGTLTASPAGPSYSAGTQVTVTATAAPGSEFTGWGNACNGTGACTVTMTANTTVTATFASTTVRVCATPGGNGLLTLPTVLEAYNAVPSGGTVLVCDGTFIVNNLTISKAVTITAEGPGMPTLDAGGGAKVFGLQNVSAGAVTISKLRFTGGVNGQVTINQNVKTTNISENEFHPPQTQPLPVEPLGYAFGVQMGGTGGTPSTVNIDRNAFIGGDQGIALNAAAAATVNITQNTFTSQVTTALTISGTAATAYNIERNNFDDCLNPCIFATVPIRVVNNTFTAHIGRPSAGPMISLYVQGGNVNPSTVTDNTIIGIGNNATARTDSATYPVRGPAIIAYAGVADVSRNHITNTFLGIGSWNGATVTASDNVIQTTFAPLTGWGGTAANLTANWNNFSDYLTAVEHAGPLNLGTFNTRCNWWGQATGPTSIYPAVPTEVYTPFALAPVAGQTHAGCTP